MGETRCMPAEEVGMLQAFLFQLQENNQLVGAVSNRIDDSSQLQEEDQQSPRRQPRTWNLWPLEPFVGNGLGLGKVLWLQWACLVAKILATWRMNVMSCCLQHL